MAILNNKLVLDNSNFKKGMNEALGLSKGLDSAIGGLTNKILGLGAAYISFDFLKDSAKSFIDSETAADNLAQAVGANGGLTSDFEELNKQAEDLSARGIFDDEDIKMAQALGLQYGITSNQMKSLTPSILDWAARMKKSPVEAMEAVAKGMRSQSKELAKLGIDYDKTKTDAQNLATIQGVLANKFKDSDETIANNTSEGKIANLKNQFDELKESIGNGLLKAFGVILPYIKIFIDAFKTGIDWIIGNTDKISGAFDGIINYFKPFINNILEGFKKISESLINFGASASQFFQPLKDLFTYLQPILLWLQEAMISFSISVIDGFSGLIDVLHTVYVALEKLGVFSFLATIFENTWSAIKKLGEGLKIIYDNTLKPLFEAISFVYGQIKELLGIKEYKVGISFPTMPKTPELINKESNLSRYFKESKDNKKGSETPGQKETVRENITITINKLVETLEVNSTNLKEGSDEIKRMVAAALNEAVMSIKATG